MSSLIASAQSLRLLKSMVYGDVTVLTPHIDNDVYYPRVVEIARVSKEESAKFLSTLWEKGYLQRTFYGKAAKCPYDGTTNIRPRLLCPNCKNEDIEKVNLLEHLTCGHVDSEDNFKKGDNLICPKDRKQLNQIGVDYRKLGKACYCLNCKEINPSPLELWVCQSGKHVFPSDDASSEKLFSYALNEDKRDSIMKILGAIQPIAEVFTIHSFRVETFSTIKGLSGVDHLIDIYAYKDKEHFTAGILVDKAIAPEEVLKLYAISLDISASKTFLIVIPKLDNASNVFARNLGLKIVEATDIDTAAHLLNDTLRL